MSIKRVYVAGPLRPKGYESKSLWIDYLLQVRKNIRYAVEVTELGFTPFCPALDLLFVLMDTTFSSMLPLYQYVVLLQILGIQHYTYWRVLNIKK